MKNKPREIRENALNQSSATPIDLATPIRRRFAAIGGVELPVPTREAIRQPPDFRKWRF